MTEIPQDVKLVLEALEAAGCEAWCVGGCVRDLRLGRTPGDWDVTTNALPEQTLALFKDRRSQRDCSTARLRSGPRSGRWRSPRSAGTGTTGITGGRSR